MVIERLVLRDDAVDIEIFRVGQSVCLEPFQRGLVSQYLNGMFTHSPDVANVIQEARFPLYGDLGEAAGIGGDDGDARGHGFEGGQTKAFVFRGEEEEVGNGKDLLHLFLFTHEPDVVADVELAAEAFGAGTLGSVADEEQFGGHFLSHDLEYVDDILHAFDLAEVGGVEEDAFAVGGDDLAEGVDG